LVAAGDAELLLANIGITEGISPTESGEYRQLLAAVHDVAEHILQLPDYISRTDFERYPREQVHRATDDQQDFGHAWAHKFLIRGNPGGQLLKGKTVCLKDNIAVAGVPQFFGTDAIPPWTPESDATVVTRALDAGANVVGTTICENFCNSTSSFTVCIPERTILSTLADANRVHKVLCIIHMLRAIRLAVAPQVVQQWLVVDLLTLRSEPTKVEAFEFLHPFVAVSVGEIQRSELLADSKPYRRRDETNAWLGAIYRYV
jgi:hypothetical protein